jgi:hypothetical protein
MKKKPPVLSFPKTRAIVQNERSWHNGGDIEIALYAGSLHRAAKTLIQTLDLQPNPKTAWDACPVILLYRQSVELHLKALVDEGCSCLLSPTDPISLYKTHSLRWLAQIVCQIIKTIQWENEFKSEGIGRLSDFSALVSELEALDPVSRTVHSDSSRSDGSVPYELQPPNVVRLAKRLDGLLHLLDATTDALAATGKQLSGEEPFHAGGSFKPTIQ